MKKLPTVADDEATKFMRMAIYEDAGRYTDATEAWSLANNGDLHEYLYWRACMLNRELETPDSSVS
jgi:hypothetical protein